MPAECASSLWRVLDSPESCNAAGHGRRRFLMKDEMLTARDQRGVEVVVSDSRRLLVRVSMQGLLWAVLFAHAPDRSHGDEEQQRWWLDTAAQLRNPSDNGLPPVLRVDANARVGSVQLAAVGRLGDEVQCPDGQRFDEVLLEFGLMLPIHIMARSLCDVDARGRPRRWASP